MMQWINQLFIIRCLNNETFSYTKFVFFEETFFVTHSVVSRASERTHKV